MSDGFASFHGIEHATAAKASASDSCIVSSRVGTLSDYYSLS